MTTQRNPYLSAGWSVAGITILLVGVALWRTPNRALTLHVLWPFVAIAALLVVGLIVYQWRFPKSKNAKIQNHLS